MRQSTVLVFARAPVPGACKTRLESALGANGCAALQRAFIEHTVHEASRSGAEAVQLCCAPDAHHPFFASISARYQVELVAQRGGDLGERMHVALAAALATSRVAFLVGTDCPAQDAGRMRAALSGLDQQAELVLRPARDGGYVGVGLARPTPSIFVGIEWGSHTVLRSTRSAARAAGLRCHELAALDDVDEPQDLARLTGTWRTVVDALRAAPEVGS